jgi:hypothetical protein
VYSDKKRRKKIMKEKDGVWFGSTNKEVLHENVASFFERL